MSSQPYILSKPLECGVSLTLALTPGADPAKALKRLAKGFEPKWGTFGIGEPLTRALAKKVPGLRTFTAMSAAGAGVPSTQQPMWMMLTGATQGDVFNILKSVEALMGKDLVVADAMSTFMYTGRDLTGYEDGTENPKGKKAEKAAILASGTGLAGSSFVAVQRWVHALAYFNLMTQASQDAIIGRNRKTNAEMPHAPLSSHVKRSTQEDFDPPAFMVRRSMPFASGNLQGLEFISYVAALDTFEVMMKRMAGLDEDGITDALFKFSRPVTGGYYWCPPLRGGKIDLRLLGL